MKQLYDTTRKLAGKYKQADRPIKDKKVSEVRQRWLLSPFLFLLAVDWIMMRTTENKTEKVVYNGALEPVGGPGFCR